MTPITYTWRLKFFQKVGLEIPEAAVEDVFPPGKFPSKRLLIIKFIDNRSVFTYFQRSCSLKNTIYQSLTVTLKWKLEKEE